MMVRLPAFLSLFPAAFSAQNLDHSSTRTGDIVRSYLSHARTYEKNHQHHDGQDVDSRTDRIPMFFVGAGGTRHPEWYDGGLTLPSDEEIPMADRLSVKSDEITVSVSPPVLEQSLSELTVTWDGTDEGKDWIGVFSPSDSDNTAYVDWVYVADAKALNPDSAAKFVFRVLNLRDPDIEIRYFRKSSTTLLAGTSQKVAFKDGIWEQTYGRLEFVAGKPPQTGGADSDVINPATNVRVSWTSGVEMEKGQPFVEFSSSKTSSDKTKSKKTKWSKWTRVYQEPQEVNKPSSTYDEPVAASTYSANMMCEAPANVSAPAKFRHPGHVHSMVLPDLPPDTLIQYRFGQKELDPSADSEGPKVAVSSTRTFRSPPAVSIAEDEPSWSFLGYADHGVAGTTNGITGETGSHTPGSYIMNHNLYRMLGVDEHSKRSLRAADGTSDEDFDPRFALHFGDIAYAWSVGFTWDLWHREVEPISSKIPYMVSLGNHEYDYYHSIEKDPSLWGLKSLQKSLNISEADSNYIWSPRPFHPSWGDYGSDSYGECSVPVFHRFHGTGSNGNFPNHGVFWYSFTFKNVHVITLSAEHDFTPNSIQYRWLEADLKRVGGGKSQSDKTKPWIVITLHRPLYKSEIFDPDRKVADQLAKSLDPLILQYKVHLVLSGHYHDYESTCPVTNWVCKPPGHAPVHLCAGSAGAWTDNASYSGEYWSLVRLETVGFLNVKVNGSDNLTVDFWGKRVQPKGAEAMENQKALADSDVFEVLDTVTIPPYVADETLESATIEGGTNEDSAEDGRQIFV